MSFASSGDEAMVVFQSRDHSPTIISQAQLSGQMMIIDNIGFARDGA